MNALEVKNISKSYKDFKLKNVSFYVPQGSITGFVGINGAGKTTTIKILLGLIKKESGEIFYGDNLFEQNRKEIKNRIGVVLDSDCFYEEMTIKEMKKVIAPMYKNWEQDRYMGYLEQFNLNENKKISALSKGMKMKFALTLALAHETDILILDEPVNGLDPLVRKELNLILTDYVSNQKKSVFFSTHIISDLDEIADNIVFMDQGTVISQKTVEELRLLNDMGMKDRVFSIENLMLDYVRGGRP